jgi:small subunit ribosomal protein S17
MAETTRRNRTTKVGIVVSDKMTKTVVVRVDRIVRHPLYKRYVRRSAKFMAHDEAGKCGIGDLVEIAESRPLSARKRWRVRKVLQRASGAAQASPEQDAAAKRA